jgi:mannose-6-phosphate isomerase
MAAKRLSMRRVEKGWGRHHLWPGFDDPRPEEPAIGEIWFCDPDGGDDELLVKYLFTSEKLSIQVHPDDEAARARGYPRGKEEAWVILAAEPDATIALGTRRPIDRETLRSAALDGSIEDLVDWKPAHAGDVIYSPAGTVHAIGPGLTLIEVQQNVDLTYRLFDYGRPRELHLDEGISVSDPKPFVADFTPVEISPGRLLLAEGRKFVLERWHGLGPQTVRIPDGLPGWFVPVSGAGTLGEARWRAGEVWRVEGEAAVSMDEGADVLFAYPLSRRLDVFG